MADMEQNKQTAIAFYERAFNDHEPEDAVERYLARGASSIPRRPTKVTRSSRSSGLTSASSRS